MLKKVTIITVLIVILLVIGILIGYIIATPTSVKPDHQTNTSNWKVYRNDKYGFEFKYPKDWILIKYPDYVELKNPNITYQYEGSQDNPITIFWRENSEHKTIKEFMQELSEHDYGGGVDIITVNNKQAIKETTYLGTSIYFINKNLILGLDLNYYGNSKLDDSLYNLFNDIVTSLHFITR